MSDFSPLIAQLGARWTIRRAAVAAGANSWTAGAETASFYACVGRSRRQQPAEVHGGAKEAESLLVIDATNCAAPGGPAVGDRVAPGTIAADAPGIVWRQITAVDAPGEGGVPLVYRCTVQK